MIDNKKLDDYQKEARDTDLNVVVSAGAGSGKTTVLAERYLRLVVDRRLSVDQILTLTFTRKAAAEMFSRIYQRLSSIDDPRLQQEVRRFDRARISTIDAFCSTIARGGCGRYGLGSNFSMNDSQLRRAAEETAIAALMEHRRDDAIAWLVSSRNFDTIIKDFFADLAVNHISIVHPPAYGAQAENQIVFLKNEITQLTQKINCLIQEILVLADGSTKSKTVETIKRVLMTLAPLESAEASYDELAHKAQAIASGDNFTNIRSNVVDPVLTALREPVKEIKEGAKNLILVLQNIRYGDRIKALGTVLDRFAQLFLERKRQEGILSFQDTAEMAVDILKTDPALRNYYKKQIKAIMIDEFQDNNSLQRELLYLLSERDDICGTGIPTVADLAPDKLFFVGDEKQSIYRFRGADVSVFRNLSKDLNSHINLPTNYRSDSPLISFFNALFPGVFGTPTEPYEADFSAIELPRSMPSKDDPPGGQGRAEDIQTPVEVYIYVNGEEDGETEDQDTAGDNRVDQDTENSDLVPLVPSEEVEAIAVANRIVEGISREEFSFGDVALLFRTTTHQNVYERIFRRVGIPFTAADPRGLYSEGPANDIYALLRLALFPGDKNAYGTVLRSPFVRLGDDAFAWVMLNFTGQPFPDGVPTAWFSSEEDQRRFEQGKTLYGEVIARIDIEPIASIISFLWFQSAYHASLLLDPNLTSNVEHFEYLYNLALEGDARHYSLGAFLDFLAPLMGTYEKMESGDVSVDRERVNFLTIHKSKGLQFPVVILPSIGSRGNNKKNGKPYYYDEEFGPVVNSRDETAPRNAKAINYLYERCKESMEKQELAELKRLFYVAATRAEHRLLFFGTHGSTTNSTLTPEMGGVDFLKNLAKSDDKPNSFLRLISQGLQNAPEQPLPIRTNRIPPLSLSDRFSTLQNLEQKLLKYLGTGFRPSEKQIAEPPSADVTKRLEAFYALGSTAPVYRKKKMTSPSEMEHWFQGSRTPSPSTPLPSLAIDPLLSKSDLESAFGTLCHHAIEATIRGNSPDIPPSVSRIFQNAGLPVSDRHRLLQEAVGLARAFFSSPMGESLLRAHRRRSEFPFLLPLPAPDGSTVIVQGIMDAIFEAGDRAIILDFKTDRSRDPGAHQIQMECYRLAASAFSDLPVTTYLIYLREATPVLLEPLNPSVQDSRVFLGNLAESALSQP